MYKKNINIKINMIIYTSGLAYEGESQDPWFLSVWPKFYQRLVNNIEEGIICHYDPEFSELEPKEPIVDGKWVQIFIKAEIPVLKPKEVSFLFDFSNAGINWPHEFTFYPRFMFCETWSYFYDFVNPFVINDGVINGLREIEKRKGLHLMAINSYPRNFMGYIMEYIVSPRSFIFEVFYEDIKKFNIFNISEIDFKLLLKPLFIEYNKLIWETDKVFSNYINFFYSFINNLSKSNGYVINEDKMFYAIQKITERENCNFKKKSDLEAFLKATFEQLNKMSNNDELLSIYYDFEFKVSQNSVFE